jgi:uncharacterized protein GlcG (DUF336 family)
MRVTGGAIWAGVLALAGVVAACGGGAGRAAPPQPAASAPTLAADEVTAILEHAARATDEPVVVAVTDRRGVVLGVGANFTLDDPAGCAAAGCPVAPTPDCERAELAVQLARTAAFFSADQTPLTSRSVRFLSGIHFPPGIANTAAAALFGIENTNRGCAFDAAYAGRCTAPAERTDAPCATNAACDATPGAGDGRCAAGLPRPRSLAALQRERAGGTPLRCESAADADARCGCTRGIATLPGGVPIYVDRGDGGGARMAGGVGVALRRMVLLPDPAASFDAPDGLRQADGDPAFDIAEFAARAFAGEPLAIPTLVRKGLVGLCESQLVPRPACCAGSPPCTFSILPVPPNPPFDPVIFIDGIEVPEVANDPPVGAGAGTFGPIRQLLIDPHASGTAAADVAPGGWLVAPRDATDAPPGVAPLAAAEVRAIIDEGREVASRTRGAVRLPLEARTAMVLAVADTNGVLLGAFRMDDATVFSIDVAIAKSRNVAYFSSVTIDPRDTLDNPAVGDVRGQAFPPGTAITNRTLGFGAQPFFPSGIDGSDPGPFRRVFLDDLATPCTNGLEPPNGRQNGIVFFPGSVPLSRDGVLVGGLGVSGDGVEQDDIVSVAGARVAPGFEPPAALRADQVSVRGVRLPYVKFNRQPNE